MAETLLTLTNLVLKATGGIQTDLTALTSNSNQQDVDNVVASINEVVDDLSELGAFPVETATGTITLLASTRAYSAATDFVALVAGPRGAPSGLMIDTTNGQWLTEYPGGYEQLRADQPIPSNATGLPAHWTIRPTDGKFYLDAIPQTADVAITRAYSYDYRVATSFTTASASATFPFADELVQRLVPVVVQAFNRERRPSLYSLAEYRRQLARATGILSRVPARTRYGPR